MGSTASMTGTTRPEATSGQIRSRVPRDDVRLVLQRSRPQGGADDGLPPHEHPAEIELVARAAQQADQDEPPGDVEGGEVVLEVAPPHRVDDDIDACGRPRAYGARPVRSAGRRGRCPVREAAGQLVLARGREAGVAPGRAHLADGRADAARARMDQHPFGWREAPHLRERHVGRAQGFGQGGGLDQVHPVGHRQHLPPRDDDAFGVAAPCEQRRDAIPHREVLDAVAEGAHGPAALEPQDRRGAGRGAGTAPGAGADRRGCRRSL